LRKDVALREGPPGFGHALGDGVVSELKFDRLCLEGFWHRDLPSLKHALILAQEGTDFGLHPGWQVRADIDLGDVMNNGRRSLAFVCLPPRLESLLPNMTYQGLPLRPPMIVNVHAQRVKARNTEEGVARSRQLCGRRDQSGNAEDLAFVEDLERAFFSKSREADRSPHIVHDDVVHIVQEFN
jgi:hypothetical protein